MDNIYRENILDHYKNPRNFGHLQNYHVKSEAGIPSCGDKIGMEVKLKVKSEKYKVVEDVRFHGEGCAISTASASILTEFVKNKSVEDVKNLSVTDILKLLGITLTPTRLKCALLSLEVLQKALNY